MQNPKRLLWIMVVLCSGLVAGQVAALVTPDTSSPAAAKVYKHPDLDISTLFELPSRLPDKAALEGALASLGVDPDHARIDRRGGRFETLILSTPLIPGDGMGNRLDWGQASPASTDALERAAWNVFITYLRENQQALGINVREVAPQGKVTVHGGGDLVQIYAQRRVAGLAVLGSYVSGTVNHGNLILLGFHRWGDVGVSTRPAIAGEAAFSRVVEHLQGLELAGRWGKTELVLLPTASGDGSYDHRLVWAVRPRVQGDLGSWEALLDAHSGELLSFEDTNHYAEVKGGVYPVLNDGVPPDGVEQAGWPMPFDVLSHAGGSVTTDASGNIPGSVTGNRTSNLAGQFIRMNDNCGAISLTTAGDVDFGTSGGDDCVTPGFGGAGNTHSSRTGFHELNRIKELARGQLPGNVWLTQQLTSNMNIDNTCNAFWNGSTVNFYRSGGGCTNTGEIAGVFDHEWGHGMDANDATPGVSSPGEGIADVYTALRLNSSCIGRNFSLGANCDGYGDPCTQCDGVRDIDFANRASGQPHDVTWAIANCGGGVHCRGYVYSEAVWDLWKRDLPALFGMDDNTAGEVVTRLTYIGAGGVGTWYSDTPPFGGCSATGGYLQYLAADDDNGNLDDGTPHMTAIFQAFHRHEAACDAPVVQSSGCANTPTVAPEVTASPLDKSANLSWSAVANATEYEVFRTDGVFQCAFGKTKVGTTAGTSFIDTDLQNGRAYSYVVTPKGPADACFGPMSSCDTVSPAAGPNLDVDPNSAVLTISGGDGDEFLDNCEMGPMTFDVLNTGLGTLTNVRVVSVTAPSHPAITFETSFPAPVSPSTLAQGATGVGSFDFTAKGLTTNDPVVFEVTLTADEVGVDKTRSLTVGRVESDFQNFASRTFNFESDLDGWTVEQGTFSRSSAIGGGDGTTWAVESSNGLDNQCDRIRSPILRLQATSTMTLWNNFDIEPLSAGTWYDRANVGVIDGGGARSLVTPDGGRLYNADSTGLGDFSGCNDPEEGWAATSATWATSSWSAGALQSGVFAGQDVHLEVIYATDAAFANRGFSFDEVTLTDVDFQVADGQSDVCNVHCNVDADCDDGLFCDGLETCVGGRCQAGTPVDCDDGVGCTDDSCNEAGDSCDNTPSDAVCDNGLFCDGAETCDPLGDCQPGADPCPAGTCDEVDDVCVELIEQVECPFISLGAVISTPAGSDVDLYELVVRREATVEIDVDAGELGSTLDSMLALFDANSNQIAVSDDRPAPGEPFTLDSYLNLLNLPAGTYYIAVSAYADFDFNGGGDAFSTGFYTLLVTCQHSCPVRVQADIGPPSGSDVDFYEIALPATDRLTIDLDADEFGSTLDPMVALFDSGFNRLFLSDDAPAPGEPFTLDSYLDVTHLAAGTYFIGVTSFADVDFDGRADAVTTGPYRLTVECSLEELTFTPDLEDATLLNDAAGPAAWHFADNCPANTLGGHSTPGSSRWGSTAECSSYGAPPGGTTDVLRTQQIFPEVCGSNPLAVSFKYFLDFEEAPLLDRARVEVEDGVTGARTVLADNGPGGGNSGIGGLRTGPAWASVAVSPTAPLPSSLFVRFVGETGDDRSNLGQGFLVDDVKVSCTDGSIFWDGFEFGNTSPWSTTVP